MGEQLDRLQWDVQAAIDGCQDGMVKVTREMLCRVREAITSPAPSPGEGDAPVAWRARTTNEHPAGQTPWDYFSSVVVPPAGVPGLEVQPLYTRPTPASPEGAADKLAHILRRKLERGEPIDAEAIDRALALATYSQDPTDEDRAWAANEAARIASPAVGDRDGLREKVETGWLVESDENGPLYHPARTRNAAEAMRFSRQKDAEAFIRAYGPKHHDSILTPAWRAVEHRWG